MGDRLIKYLYKQRAVMVLLFLPQCIELITGSTPIGRYVQPFVIIFFVCAYGLPVLLIREYAIRKQLSAIGIISLGIAYGVFNEGLLARTMTASGHLPIPEFDVYMTVGGIHLFPWAVTISLFHALASVLLPIAFTHTFFPEDRKRTWLTTRTVVIGTGILLTLASFIFFAESSDPIAGWQWIIFLFSICFFVLLAPHLPKAVQPDISPSTGNKKALALGLGVVIPVIVYHVMAKAHVPSFLLLVFLVATVFLYIKILKERQWKTGESLLLFGVGFYMQSALIGTLAGAMMPETAVQRVITGVVLEGILIFVAIKLLKPKEVTTAAV